MKKEVINSPIRWAGSKKKILNEVLTLFDKESEYYVEPFLGSGVVLINLMNNIKKFKFKKSKKWLTKLSTCGKVDKSSIKTKNFIKKVLKKT